MSIPSDVFEEDYRQTPDPFGHLDNPFEIMRYHAQFALLTDRHVADGLELGCSIGIFTAMLAPRCDRLLALDCAPSAIAQARERCAALPNVRAEVATLPAEFPDGTFDLVTFSEFGYYLDDGDLTRMRERIINATRPGALLIVAHMTVDFEPYGNHALPSTSEHVHAAYQGDPNFEHRTRLKGYEGDMSGPELYWCDLFERV
jgi:SAM-dependent methyltransferase